MQHCGTHRADDDIQDSLVAESRCVAAPNLTLRHLAFGRKASRSGVFSNNDAYSLDKSCCRQDFLARGRMKYVARSIGAYVAFAAILLRAALPAGWMPNPNGVAQSPLIICPMENPGAMMPGMNGPRSEMPGMDRRPADRQHDKNSEHDRPICPFAAVPHLAPPVAASALPLPSLVAPTVYRVVRVCIAQRPSRHAPQSPRAPPLFA